VGTTSIGAVAGVHSLFSNKVASVPPLPFAVSDNATKPVVILQVADPREPDGIAWQAFFFGRDPNQFGTVHQSTFARAISVWPAVDATGEPDYARTRIAICGESWDPRLPPGDAPRPNWNTAYGPSGFIAVYSGEGDLLWSFPFYGQDISASTAVTDVSIRVTAEGDEVVTYCGMSTNGNYQVPGGLGTMILVREFDSPGAPAPGCGVAYASGGYHNGVLPNVIAYGWDGFVGRITYRPPTPTVPATFTTNFHSIVGGNGDDALFGLSELDDQIFSVCGTTKTVTNPTTTVVFPFTDATYNQQPYCLWGGESGVVLTFQDDPSQPKLVLISSYPIGSPGQSTGASDLIWHGRDPNGPRMYVVGTTSDPTFNLIPPNANAIKANLVGPSDGYVAIGNLLNLEYASLLSDASDLVDTVTSDYLRRGAVGIAAWNEFHDHIAVVGWAETYDPGLAAPENRRITIDNLFRADAGLQRIRRGIIDAGSAGRRLDKPGTALGGFQNVQVSTNPQFTDTVGSQPGGGCAVNPQGLVSVVGSMLFQYPLGGTSFPVVGPSLQVRSNEGSVLANRDAVRLLADMLPTNVCRTDGVDCPSLGWVKNSGDGGTTPPCARAMNGTILNPTPQLERIFIDFEGLPAAGYAAAILVDRPPSGFTTAGFLQLGFPLPDPVLLPNDLPGIELWASGQAVAQLNVFSGGSSYREPLWGPAGLPAGSHQFSVQFISMQPGAALCGSSSFIYAASPALLVGY